MSTGGEGYNCYNCGGFVRWNTVHFCGNSYSLQNQWFYPPTMSQGWQCPKCSSIYAPNVTECFRCNYPVVTITTGTVDVTIKANEAEQDAERAEHIN